MPNIITLIIVAAVMFCVPGDITLLAHIYNLNNIKSKTVGDGQHGKRDTAEETRVGIYKKCRPITRFTFRIIFPQFVLCRFILCC